MSFRDVDIEEVDAGQVRPLRTQILRPHFGESRLAEFDGDQAADTHHFALRTDDDGDDDGAEEGAAIVGVISYMQTELPDSLPADTPAWRLRGMAVAEHRRGEGLGRRLLEVSLGRMQILEAEMRAVWCRARTSAAGFYEKHGFERHGEVFEVPEIGPHVLMWREVIGALA